MTLDEAEQLLSEAGYGIAVKNGPLASDSAVLVQSPPGGWKAPTPELVDVSQEPYDPESDSTLPATSAAAVIATADQVLADEGLTGQLTLLTPSDDGTKGPCRNRLCVTVDYSVEGRRFTVLVEPEDPPIVQDARFINERLPVPILKSADELVAAALAAPDVRASLGGPASGHPLGGTELSSECRGWDGSNICQLVWLASGDRVVTAVVNYITGEARLAREAVSARTAPPALGTPPPAETAIVLEARNRTFSLAQISVPAGVTPAIQLISHDPQPMLHNLALAPLSGGDPFWHGTYAWLGEPQVYQPPALPAGQYRFSCELHPSMSGIYHVIPATSP